MPGNPPTETRTVATLASLKLAQLQIDVCQEAEAARRYATIKPVGIPVVGIAHALPGPAMILFLVINIVPRCEG